jgi:hypothetical protein
VRSAEGSKRVLVEGLTTCVGYGDFLAATLPLNRHVFDHLLVVTTQEDVETQRVCEYYDVECLLTGGFHASGEPFNKGKGINAGLSLLTQTGRVVHFDADIVLPPKARQVLREAPLDPETLYGIDRVFCRSYDDWTRFLRLPALHHQLDVLIHAPPFRFASRIARSPYGGYLPIGFFQLWSPSATGPRWYAEDHDDAARTDVAFARQWPRERRALLPELIAIHLESESAEPGANWSGRTTAPFGPEPLEQVAAELDRSNASAWAVRYDGPSPVTGGAAA